MLDEYTQRYIGSKIIDLTENETNILDLLIRKKKDTTTAEQLSKYVFGKKDKQEHIKVILCRLKKKLKGEVIINNKYGVGYKIKYIGD